MTGSQCWALGRMGCGHCGFQKPNSEFLSSRKEGEAARVSGAGLTSVWLREAVVGAGWWGGEGSWAERETLRERVALTLGLQVTVRGRGRRPGNPDIPSGPPKTSVEHSVWIRALGSQVPPESPPIWPQPYKPLASLAKHCSRHRHGNPSPPGIGISRFPPPLPVAFKISAHTRVLRHGPNKECT